MSNQIKVYNVEKGFRIYDDYVNIIVEGVPPEDVETLFNILIDCRDEDYSDELTEMFNYLIDGEQSIYFNDEFYDFGDIETFARA